MLPEHSRYDYLANLPEGENISDSVNNAMKLIDGLLQWLPQETYPDEELGDKSFKVYQHIYTNY